MYSPAPSDKVPPCQRGCPNGNDVRGWISLIAERHKTGMGKDAAYRMAWERLAGGNPFPATMGRICPHPCEGLCSRGDKDGPVAIRDLERFLGDWALSAGLRLRKEEGATEREPVGVIGGGPAGLSFAYQMARRGYRVTLYERSPRLGGMLFHGIPRYRLPKRVLDGELDRILDLGVEVRLGTLVGGDVSIDELKRRHAALFVGIGAQRGRSLGVPGDEGPGVVAGTDFLAAVNHGEAPRPGPRVVVVGGGNTAMDAARTARRLGASVSLLYRRSLDEMPASRVEVEEAVAEGVELVLLATPTRVVRANGAVVAVEAQRTRLGEADASGRRRPVPVPGATFGISADTVIAAVSQDPDWTGLLDEVRPDRAWIEGEADHELWPGVWAGGDARGLGIAGTAIAHGRAAAESVHRRLRGIAGDRPADDRPRVGPGDVKPQYYLDRARVVPPSVAVEERLSNPEREGTATIDEGQFLAEVARCFSCGLCFGCRHCQTYCNGHAFSGIVSPAPGAYFALAVDRCDRCGKCVDLCPCGYLSPSSEARRPI